MAEEVLTPEMELEKKKVKALEKIAVNVEAIALWLEEIDKTDWSDRIQWYLDMFKRAYLDPKLDSQTLNG